jgi:hypothetical protein
MKPPAELVAVTFSPYDRGCPDTQPGDRLVWAPPSMRVPLCDVMAAEAERARFESPADRGYVVRGFRMGSDGRYHDGGSIFGFTQERPAAWALAVEIGG